MLTMKNKKLVIKYQKVKDEYKVINTKFVFCEEMKQKYRQLYKNALDLLAKYKKSKEEQKK
jgi:sulfur transfer protein SufE